MKTDAVIDLVRVVGVDPPCDRAGIVDGLAAVSRLKSWVQATELVWVTALTSCSSFPERDLARTNRCSTGAANKVLVRAKTTSGAPAFGAGLADGSLTAEHVDVLTGVLRGEEPVIRAAVLARSDTLAAAAASQSVDEFRRVLTGEVRRLRTDDGMTRLNQQRRDTRCRTWTDLVTGMWHLNTVFDPATAVALAQRLDTALQDLYGRQVPQGCPRDPIAKQDYLRALALAELITGQTRAGTGAESGAGGGALAGVGGGGGVGGGAGVGAEVIVVIDLTQAVTEIDWGIPVELPAAILHDLLDAASTEVHGVVTRNGIIISAPGVLNLGRTTRLANRAQRRALRAVHRTCAIPDCAVRFNHCKIHHVHWWEHGGPTDLNNLVPVCPRHHAAIHTAHITIELGPRRTVTVTATDRQDQNGAHAANRSHAPP